ncbi:MAG TPA: DUF2249 domain-containing protein [Solirubrobacteraceae bacterium]|nr:DUF2249 domain-containing protein [Solirubrobacteraceae bacterium]
MDGRHRDRAQLSEALTEALLESLAALGRAGAAEHANRIAARAWWALRAEHPREAQRINVLMHRLMKHETTKEQSMSAPENELDVRSIPPARRHELIFETYERLAPGAGFILVNDHDPKPLRYQFEAEHAGEFSWDYLEQGPETWRVRIGRPAAVAA